jgi:hypothetical protein
MKQILLFLSVFCTIGFSNAQGIVPAGSRSMSMGNASTTFDDVWAYQNNPGALGAITTFSAGLSYENRFLLKEFQTQGFAVAIPLKVGVISFGGDMFGYRNYRSYQAGVGYSMKLSEKFSAGVQLNYKGLSLSSNYGSKHTISAAAGIYAKVTENWKIGVSAYNVGRAKLSDFEDDRFSTVLRLGTSYLFSKKFLIAIEGEKDIDNPFRFKTGLEYEPLKNFFIRGGVQTTPIEFSFGFGYHFKQVHLGVGSSYHQILGWSPNFSIVFQAKEKE